MKLEIIFYPFHTHPTGWCEYHIKGFKILTYNETGCNILSISFVFDAPGEFDILDELFYYYFGPFCNFDTFFDQFIITKTYWFNLQFTKSFGVDL